jgi:hypothetical protein
MLHSPSCRRLLLPPRNANRAVKALFAMPAERNEPLFAEPCQSPCYEGGSAGGHVVTQWHERLNGFLGRLLFRAAGLMCGVVALVCGYAAWWHIEHWDPKLSLVPTILFGIAALAAASCVPYCFSRKRTFVEALDAMEGGVGDQHRPR